jgi:hypothetical protein
MAHQRFLLECPHCGESKLINVAVSDDGLMGPVKCDECKTASLRLSARRPVRRTVESAPQAQAPAPAPEPEKRPSAPFGRALKRFRLSP